MIGICLGERPNSGGTISAAAYLESNRRPVVILTETPGKGGPLPVVSTPCAVFEISRDLASADWSQVRIVNDIK
jgi:hypothetical protein